MRLLLAEDDARLSARLRSDLQQAGFAVDVADNGVDAEFMGESEPYDVVVLDLGLPGRPGLEVLRHWRAAENPVPVLILTARDAWHEKVDGFKAGADDYLSKPFHTAELIARLQGGSGWQHDAQLNALQHDPLPAAPALRGGQLQRLRGQRVGRAFRGGDAGADEHFAVSGE